MPPFKVESKQNKPKLNIARIQEAVITAVVTAVLSAGIVTWSTTRILEIRLDVLEQNVQKLLNDFYTPRLSKGHEDGKR